MQTTSKNVNCHDWHPSWNIKRQRQRQREGIALAKKRGVYRGRTPSLDTVRAAELREKAAAGVPKSVLAREFGISRETVYVYLRAKA
ncbi:Hin recombinase [Cryobacterium frigoriphilum]|uniref:Hin recombinase n=1 Tax=Cryobacterium frigoriphilum TaxID=1259150 RepID=A0A4R9A1G4_9MICO|nr:Hin recombinase [Cryobacterium frigoriphilum]